MIARVLLLLALLTCGAQAQGPILPGPGLPVAGGGSSYTGPGDIQTSLRFGSVARVYNNAKASTSTQMADLVASGNGAAVCTLRGSTAGTADISSSYCAGTTPAAACAAANGGSCKVSRLYEQVGITNHWTQATLSQMPGIAFSAINGLPSLTCSAANATIMTSTGPTQAQPFVFVGVANKTATAATTTEIMASTINDVEFGFDSTDNFAIMYAGNSPTTAAANNAFHVISGEFSGTGTSLLNVDGTTNTGLNSGANTLTGNLSICGYTVSLYHTGFVAEVNVYAGNYSAGVHANTRTAYGL